MISENLIWFSVIFSVASSMTGALFVFYAYRKQHYNRIEDIIRIRDELIKLSLLSSFSESQRADLMPLIELAFSRANEELDTTIETVIGTRPARQILAVLDQSNASRQRTERYHG